jgi:hypothetical protein
MGGNERRREPRVSFRSKISVRFGDEPAISTYPINLSVGGIGIELTSGRPAGTPVAVQLDLSDGVRLDLVGVVRHATQVSSQAIGFPGTSRNMIGIQFSNVTPDVAQRIKEALEDEDAE